MTLSKEQKEFDKLRFQKWFWIWERDLLWLAAKFSAWRAKAQELGFNDTRISAPWQHADAGKLIRYMENPWYALKLSGK